MTEHGGSKSLGVVLHGAPDRAALAKAGLKYRCSSRTSSPRTAREAAPAPSRGPPERPARTYRTLADYESELKTLAAANPRLVRLITLPNKTWIGRDVLGIEITENVTLNDGKPAFVNMGVHHAREWPAGEMTMEWAYELGHEYKGGRCAREGHRPQEPQHRRADHGNPDGFDASRTARGVLAGRTAAETRASTTPFTSSAARAPAQYRRKNCRKGEIANRDPPAGNCASSAGLAKLAWNRIRNDGQFWGGPGSDTNFATQTYRGPGPFSEPESRNIQWLVSNNQVASLITNHTTAGPRPARTRPRGGRSPIDENNGYKALGDAMAKENGYFSQKGWELYDTTGTTEDWSYNATGGYGFTFEIYCGAPNYQTGDCESGVPPALRHDGRGVGRHQPAGGPHQRPARPLQRQRQPRGLLPRG